MFHQLNFEKNLLVSFIITSTLACQSSEIEYYVKNQRYDIREKLLKASSNEDIDIVKGLLDENCSINVTTKNSQTPLILAAVLGSNRKILNILFHYENNNTVIGEFNIDQQDNEGNTALIYTLLYSFNPYFSLAQRDNSLIDLSLSFEAVHIDIGKKSAYSLLKSGANPTIKNNNGISFKDLLLPRENDIKDIKGSKYEIAKIYNRIIKKRLKQRKKVESILCNTCGMSTDLMLVFMSYLDSVKDSFKIDTSKYFPKKTKGKLKKSQLVS